MCMSFRYQKKRTLIRDDNQNAVEISTFSIFCCFPYYWMCAACVTVLIFRNSCNRCNVTVILPYFTVILYGVNQTQHIYILYIDRSHSVCVVPLDKHRRLTVTSGWSLCLTPIIYFRFYFQIHTKLLMSKNNKPVNIFESNRYRRVPVTVIHCRNCTNGCE